MSVIGTAFFFILLLNIPLQFIGLYGIFKKLGIPAWKGLVPIYNWLVWLEVIKRPKWWLIMLFIPGVDLFYGAGMAIELATCFGKFSFLDHAASILLNGYYFTYLGFTEKEKFVGIGGVRPGQTPPKRGAFREWADAIVFAVVAATLIRIFVAEAYMIPTPSMEKTLLVGDFLFVSKFQYGARIPNTPLALPFVHHTIPVLNIRSYVEWIKLPYKTLPGFEHVKRNDMVVFNFPAGDTVVLENQGPSYYDIVRYTAYQNRVDYNTARQLLWTDPNTHIAARPVDKRENYIKRCVGVPGDKLEVKSGVLFINDEPAYRPENLYTPYTVYFSDSSTLVKDEDANWVNINKRYFVTIDKRPGLEKFEMDPINSRFVDGSSGQLTLKPGENILLMTQSNAEALKASGMATFVEPFAYAKGKQQSVVEDIFPNDTRYYNWNVDNFGPVYLPKKGETITLNDSIYDQYDRAIRVYENNKVERKDGKFFIDGQQTSTYTFKMDYYWMMGDNRHNSQDSRYWGFVPEDHIVGKAWFIWMSYGSQGNLFQRIRWSRFFTSIHGKWAPPADSKYEK